MISILPAQLSALSQVRFHGAHFNKIHEICYDSRKIRRASEAVFVALVTSRNNGHRFIHDAYKSGIRMFLVSELPGDLLENAAYAQVPDTLEALQELALMHRNSVHGGFVGITGSNGKTVVKEWIYTCLQDSRAIYRSPRSFNSQLGVALSVLAVPADANPVIIEAGISQPDEMENLEKIIQPETGIFTNLLSAHSENFSSREALLEEKMKLFSNCKTLICSSRYPEIILKARQIKLDLFTWGEAENDDIQIIESIPKFGKALNKLKYKNAEFILQIPFTDSASLENAMHVVAYLLFQGLPADELQQKISRIQPREMRLESISGVHNCLIINDTWSADMHSLLLALESLAIQPYDKKTLIVSDLPEAANNPELYRALASHASEKGISRIIGVGEQISNYASFFNLNREFFLSTEELLERLPALNFRDECILLKGARIFRFERIAAQLQEKKHETLLEVNLSNLVDNLNFYRKKAGRKIKMMAMVKAFAYGSGSIEIARTLQFHGIDYLAVAYADEGVILRKAGINSPILVLSPETDSLKNVLEYNLEPEIYSFRMLNLLISEIEDAGIDEVLVQIKLDTGMHRLGFQEHEIEALIEQIKSNPKIRISGIFSHLAASDNPEQDEFTRLQISRFNNWSEKIKNAVTYPVLRHILNSSGISRFPEGAFDMVRLGIGMYGIGSQEDSKFLKNVTCLKTTVSQIHVLQAGETVGYGRKGKINRPSKIATIPIGYADGFLRSLGNGNAIVRINGKTAPTIGQICMDMCMIDVTEIDNVSEGDEVIIFENAADIHRLASNLGTIPYEVLTGISQRVKRVYVEQ